MRSSLIAGAFALGLALRLVALPLAGSTDLPIFALWADTASAEGVGRIYGTGGHFPERRLLERDGVATKVNYPPLLLDEFSAARALHLPLKALTIIADAVFALALWLLARRGAAVPAHVAALAYWLNPAAILTGSVLGYVEPLMVLPAATAVIAAAAGRPALAGMLTGAALLTKQNAILALPAIGLALVAVARRPAVSARVTRFAAGAAAVAAVAIAPVVWSGGALNMAWSMASPLRDPFLSGNAANVWWLVGRLPRGVPLDLCRAGAALVVSAIVAWTIAAVRAPDCADGADRRRSSRGWLGFLILEPRIARTDVWLCAAGGALAFHAYHTLAVSAHEPHLFPAVGLLALAAVGRPRFWGPFAAVSAVAALNVGAFYQTASVLAVANCVAFVWHASVYRREARGRGATHTIATWPATPEAAGSSAAASVPRPPGRSPSGG